MLLLYYIFGLYIIYLWTFNVESGPEGAILYILSKRNSLAFWEKHFLYAMLR